MTPEEIQKEIERIGGELSKLSKLLYETRLPSSYRFTLPVRMADLQFNSIALADVRGFIIIPTCAGTPTGVPKANGAMVYDTTNNLLYVYNGAWKSVALA